MDERSEWQPTSRDGQYAFTAFSHGHGFETLVEKQEDPKDAD